MSGTIPTAPKIYHIVHVDRLSSIINAGSVFSDAFMRKHEIDGTVIGMSHIKERRLKTELPCHPGLYVGDCVPFYFCPRSVMLYVISQENNPDLAYTGGQQKIIHLEADLRRVAEWARNDGKRWSFTLTNAGSSFFENRAELSQLNELDWDAIGATDWRSCKDEKQAEFLLEDRFPISLIERIGVSTKDILSEVSRVLASSEVRPVLEVKPEWYY